MSAVLSCSAFFCRTECVDRFSTSDMVSVFSMNSVEPDHSVNMVIHLTFQSTHFISHSTHVQSLV